MRPRIVARPANGQARARSAPTHSHKRSWNLRIEKSTPFFPHRRSAPRHRPHQISSISDADYSIRAVRQNPLLWDLPYVADDLVHVLAISVTMLPSMRQTCEPNNVILRNDRTVGRLLMYPISPSSVLSRKDSGRSCLCARYLVNDFPLTPSGKQNGQRDVTNAISKMTWLRVYGCRYREDCKRYTLRAISRRSFAGA
jgi:hypothetical protein